MLLVGTDIHGVLAVTNDATKDQVQVRKIETISNASSPLSPSKDSIEHSGGYGVVLGTGEAPNK